MEGFGYLLITGLLGVAVGIGLHFMTSRATRLRLEREIAEFDAQIKTDAVRAEERETALKMAEQALSTTFGKLAHDSLEKNSETFLRLARENLGAHQERARAELREKEKAVQNLVKPIQEALERTHKQIAEIEKSRLEAYGSIKTQLAVIDIGQNTLRAETNKLVTALSKPQVRGQWGELTLRRLVELAGMVKHCDFAEQVHVSGEDGAVRPDMVIRLPEQGELIVDAKTPLDAYLAAIEASDNEVRATALKQHARNLQDRVRELSSKAYWSRFEHSPEFVIMFIPGDQFLTAALDVQPGLLEDALRQKVMLITPTSLVALLKVVAYGWLQLNLARNTEEIRVLAEDLHDRLAGFTGHLAKVGKHLDSSVKSYNDAIGSLESRVLPKARKFRELGLRPRRELDDPATVEKTTRPIKELAGTDPVVLGDTGKEDSIADEPPQEPTSPRH